MPTKLNGYDVSNVFFNGNTVQTIYFNGNAVFTATQQTVDPTLYNYTYSPIHSDKVTINIINNDLDSVTMYGEALDSTPDVDIGTWLSGEDKSYTFYGAFNGDTIYVMAQAAGKDPSNIISISS